MVMIKMLTHRGFSMLVGLHQLCAHLEGILHPCFLTNLQF